MFLVLDYAIDKSTSFQDLASDWMLSIVDLHDRIIFYLLIILAVVVWFQMSALFFSVDYLGNLANGNWVELVWTVSPALVLWAIGLPSLRLLYLMDEMIDPTVTVRIMGSQWFWSIEYYFDSYDSFLVADVDLMVGYLRQLAVDNPIVLPISTQIRLLISANDVIHSFAMPSLALKIDAIPGRLNVAGLILNRVGTFYGQCSELCGVLHGFMPIVIRAVSLPHYYYFTTGLDTVQELTPPAALLLSPKESVMWWPHLLSYFLPVLECSGNPSIINTDTNSPLSSSLPPSTMHRSLFYLPLIQTPVGSFEQPIINIGEQSVGIFDQPVQASIEVAGVKASVEGTPKAFGNLAIDLADSYLTRPVKLLADTITIGTAAGAAAKVLGGVPVGPSLFLGSMTFGAIAVTSLTFGKNIGQSMARGANIVNVPASPGLEPSTFEGDVSGLLISPFEDFMFYVNLPLLSDITPLSEYMAIHLLCHLFIAFAIIAHFLSYISYYLFGWVISYINENYPKTNSRLMSILKFFYTNSEKVITSNWIKLYLLFLAMVVLLLSFYQLYPIAKHLHIIETANYYANSVK